MQVSQIDQAANTRGDMFEAVAADETERLEYLVIEKFKNLGGQVTGEKYPDIPITGIF